MITFLLQCFVEELPGYQHGAASVCQVCSSLCIHSVMPQVHSTCYFEIPFPFGGRILERTPAQLQARQLRCFSDVLVYDLTQGNLKTTHTTQQVLAACVGGEMMYFEQYDCISTICVPTICISTICVPTVCIRTYNMCTYSMYTYLQYVYLQYVYLYCYVLYLANRWWYYPNQSAALDSAELPGVDTPPLIRSQRSHSQSSICRRFPVNRM